MMRWEVKTSGYSGNNSRSISDCKQRARSIIYHRGRMHFFAYDGFVMYTFECKDEDFGQKVLKAIEFSNYQWSE